jgi:hypothetical protein
MSRKDRVAGTELDGEAGGRHVLNPLTAARRLDAVFSALHGT